MTKLDRIFVEGEIDKVFIEALLKKHFNIENDKLVIVSGGKDNLKRLPILFDVERKNKSAKNLLIFDTDYIEKGGGRAKRIEEYKMIQKELNLNFEIYLFPNNDETEGEVEDLIKTCFLADFAFFDECWNGMISCLENNKIEKPLNVPAKEGFLFSKIDLFKNHRQNETWNYAKLTKYDYTDEGIWNLETKNNPKLEKLVHFIKENLFDE
jgi:hypothetical protein